MGALWTSPPIPLPEDVCTHKGYLAKRIPSWGPLWSPATIARKRPPGKGFCHGDINTRNHLGQSYGLVPGGLSNLKKPQRDSLLRRHHRKTRLEILETLKDSFWHRWGPAKLDRECRQSTFRMPVQVEFHAEVQATYDHFGCYHSRQQESQEDALQLLRDPHHQALATMAMLEGYIECLHCFISWGWHRDQGDWAVDWGQEAGSAQEATVTQGTTEGIHCLVQKDRCSQQKAALGMHPKGRQTHPVPCDPGGRSPLRTPAQIPIQKWPSRLQTGHQPVEGVWLSPTIWQLWWDCWNSRLFTPCEKVTVPHHLATPMRQQEQ